MSRVKWLDNAVFYEIYPQSFYDTNSDGIGDINGIIEKLDYITALGCNALWINPCFTSPFFDAGYDISDYYSIAPRYGTNNDIKRLFNIAHQKNIHILLDLVPGHTSIEHPWFKESMKAEENEYTHRYIWSDDVWKDIPGFKTLRGISDRDGSCVVNYFSIQPALNYGFYEIDDPKWQQPMDAEGPQKSLNEILNIMRFWLDMGCDGFRIDMAEYMIKNDPERKGTIKFWQKVLGTIKKEYPDAALLSEWGMPEKSLEAGFDMDFFLHCGNTHYLDLFRENPYFSEDGIGNLNAFIENYKKVYSDTNGKGLMCMPSGNHDMIRISETLSDTQMRLAFAFILSLPGAPFIYYGDEIGMKYLNLVSKEGGYFRTGSRTPMQWNSEKNCGFSTAESDKLYLQQDPDQNKPTVEKQIADKSSLWNLIKKLIKVRRSHECLQSDAKIEFLEWGYPLVYRRSTAKESILVIINPKAAPAKVCAKGEILFTIGNTKLENEICHLDGCTAVFIKE